MEDLSEVPGRDERGPGSRSGKDDRGRVVVNCVCSGDGSIVEVL